ncbi:MAG: hypothetical protein R3C44_14650 [Chloroflexota bacterium]
MIDINQATFAGNSAVSAGGAIYQEATGGKAEIITNNLTLSGNNSGGNGGGIANLGTGDEAVVRLNFATLSGNSAPTGGALFLTETSGQSIVLTGSSIIEGTGMIAPCPAALWYPTASIWAVMQLAI